MDYETYRKQYFADPLPVPRFHYVGLNGLTLYYSDYTTAVGYYERVLGPPAYVEGENTRGWQYLADAASRRDRQSTKY